MPFPEPAVQEVVVAVDPNDQVWDEAVFPEAPLERRLLKRADAPALHWCQRRLTEVAPLADWHLYETDCWLAALLSSGF